MANLSLIPAAAVYIFLILAFFFAPTIFWASLAVILLVYLIQPQMITDVGQTVFTNLVWVALALVLLLIVIGLIMFFVFKNKVSSGINSVRGMLYDSDGKLRTIPGITINMA